MPEGVPKTEGERKETHKELYGTEDIPKERGGYGDVREKINKEASKKFLGISRAELVIDIILIALLIAVLLRL